MLTNGERHVPVEICWHSSRMIIKSQTRIVAFHLRSLSWADGTFASCFLRLDVSVFLVLRILMGSSRRIFSSIYSHGYYGLADLVFWLRKKKKNDQDAFLRSEKQFTSDYPPVARRISSRRTENKMIWAEEKLLSLSSNETCLLFPTWDKTALAARSGDTWSRRIVRSFAFLRTIFAQTFAKAIHHASEDHRIDDQIDDPVKG